MYLYHFTSSFLDTNPQPHLSSHSLLSTDSPKPMTKLMDLLDCTYPKESATLITPSSPTPTPTLPLSNLDDQPFLRFSIRYLYLYKRSPCVESMKLSLSRVLVAYYPLAGWLRPSGGGEDHGAKLEVDCNGEGTQFAEGYMGLSVGEFLERSRRPNRSWRKLLYRVEGQPQWGDVPPLVIQGPQFCVCVDYQVFLAQCG